MVDVVQLIEIEMKKIEYQIDWPESAAKKQIQSRKINQEMREDVFKLK